MAKSKKVAPNPALNKPIVMRSLPADDIDSVIAMLRNHAYSKEEMNECGYDANRIEDLDALAFDNAIMIELLGGALDGDDA